MFTVEGKGEAEGGALAKLGTEPDFAAHFFDHLFDDEEAEAGAGGMGGFFGAKEAGEDFLLGFWGNAMALVGDVGGHVFAVGFVGDGDGALVGVFDGVADQVVDDFSDAVGVGHDGDFLLGKGLIVELDIFLIGEGFDVLDDLFDEGEDFGGFGVDLNGFGFGAGDFEEIVDELDQLGVGGVDLVDGGLDFCGDFAVGAVGEHGEVAFDDGDGGFEFVGGDEDEFVFEFVEVAKFAIGCGEVVGGLFDFFSQGDVEVFDLVELLGVLEGDGELGGDDVKGF